MAIGLKWLEDKRRHNYESNNIKGKIYIGVYSDNFRAQRFYQKYKFEKVGEYFYEVGRCRDLEYIMQMKE